MSLLTVFLLLVIVMCTLFTVLFNSVTIKLGRLESSQKEFEAQQKRHFDLNHQAEVAEAELADVEKSIASAKETYDAAMAAYNESISRFPGMFIAGIFGFEPINSVEKDDF